MNRCCFALHRITTACQLEYQEAPKCATLASLAEATQFVLDNQFETLVALGPSNFFATAHSGRHLAMLVLDVANSEARLEQFRGLARNAGQEHLPAAVHQKYALCCRTPLTYV